jgi:Putative transposase of IS4/5 family (DUF4096)
MRYELSDSEWAAIKPFLPNKSRGVRRVNDRRVLNGIFWVLLFRCTMARSASLVWPTHHLLQPFRPVAKSRGMGPDYGHARIHSGYAPSRFCLGYDLGRSGEADAGRAKYATLLHHRLHFI